MPQQQQQQISQRYHSGVVHNHRPGMHGIICCFIPAYNIQISEEQPACKHDIGNRLIIEATNMMRLAVLHQQVADVL
jgi:hypothetical protein